MIEQTTIENVTTEVPAWREATAGRLANGRISGRCLPEQDKKVAVRLVGGEQTVAQLTWAYRWLLKDGRVMPSQHVTHWQPLAAN